jgi:calcium-dependent protein kinase
MQKATYAFIASQLVTKKEIEDVSKLFRGIDDDNDGKLDKEELKKIYFNHYGKHLTDTELNQIYDKIDIDGSGKIDYSEFVVASMNEKELLSKEKL